jgi:DNA polymerase-3 subunit gamma/tau
VFVLATTEANKVPATVVDRCHRFDFQRPTVEQIAHVVRRAAAAESIEIPPAAVAALARSATGSFRDALGTLEQLVTYSGEQIALEDVLAVLGVADASLLEATLDAVAAGDARGALMTLEQCAEQGRDAASFAADLEVRARELLVVQVLGELPAELALTPEADAALQAQAERIDHATVVRVLELLGDAMEAVRAGADARTRLELALVKAAKPEVDGSMRALLARIERLERGGGAVSVEAERRPPAAEPQSRAVQPQPPTAEPEPPAPAVEPEPPPPPRAAHDLESVCSQWPAVVELIRGEHSLLWACIADARPVAVEDGELTLGYASDAVFHKKQAEAADNRRALSEALRSVTGAPWRVAYELREDLESDGRTDAGSEEQWVARFMKEFDAEELSEDEAVTSNEKGQ